MGTFFCCLLRLTRFLRSRAGRVEDTLIWLELASANALIESRLKAHLVSLDVVGLEMCAKGSFYGRRRSGTL